MPIQDSCSGSSCNGAGNIRWLRRNWSMTASLTARLPYAARLPDRATIFSHDLNMRI